MSAKKALLWVVFWFCLALSFGLGIYYFLGPGKFMEYVGGYVIEFSLSMDNMFLFLVIFSSFGIKTKYQRRVLNYGIFGAIILRFIFISLGIAVVNSFHWVLYIFGCILMYTGLRILISEDDTKEFHESKVLKVLKKFIPFTDRLCNDKFFVKIKKKRYATPLFAILLIIESSDIMFAIDSIPAIFSVTQDTFIVYCSNIFAIMGLRSLYFLLERASGMFRFVKQGVAIVLTFTGIKLALLMFHVEIPLTYTLLGIVGILVISIIASVGRNSQTIPIKGKQFANKLNKV